MLNYDSILWQKCTLLLVHCRNANPVVKKCSILFHAGGRMLSVFRQPVLGIRLTDFDGELNRDLQTYTPSDTSRKIGC